MASLPASVAKFNDAVTRRDAAALQDLVTHDAVLHQGNSALLKLKAASEDGDALAAWGNTSSASPELLASATSEEDKNSFSLVWYKGGSQADSTEKAADILTIWHAIWTADGTAIKELAAYSGDPAHKAFKDDPLDPATFARAADGSSGAGGPGADKVTAAAAAFCGLYDTADVDAVPSVLSETFKEWSTSTGKIKAGRDVVQANLRDHGKYWKSAKNARRVAATDAASGFLAWASLGHLAGADGSFDTTTTPQLYAGLDFVIVDANGLVTRSVHLDLPEAKNAPLGWTGF